LLRLPSGSRTSVYVIGVLSLVLSVTTKIRAQGTQLDTTS
jgi:hypothetical protein